MDERLSDLRGLPKDEPTKLYETMRLWTDDVSDATLRYRAALCQSVLRAGDADYKRNIIHIDAYIDVWEGRDTYRRIEGHNVKKTSAGITLAFLKRWNEERKSYANYINHVVDRLQQYR